MTAAHSRGAGAPLRLVLTGILPALLCVGGLYGQAQPAKPTEYEVKAAYLSNFGRFVEFPQDQSAGTQTSGTAEPVEPFNICVLGADPFGPALDRALAGETINRVPLVSKRIARVQEAPGCRILFIAASESKQLKPILDALGTLPNGDKGILTVSDDPQFTRRGGMIQFVFDAGPDGKTSRVRFEINLAAAQRAHLSLSSELVKLATAVRRAP